MSRLSRRLSKEAQTKWYSRKQDLELLITQMCIRDRTYRGYKTQILEFVDFAHSPKNLLIRAVKSAIPKEKRERSLQEVERMCEEMHIVPSIYNLLK